MTLSKKCRRLRPSAKTEDKSGWIDFFQKCIIACEKFFLFWVPMNIKKDRKAKVESVYSFYVKTFLNNSVLRNMFVIPKKIVLNCMYKVKIKTGYLKKRQLLRLGMLPPFLTIFLPTTYQSSTKFWCRRSFWGAKCV